eukprot:4861522-Amphidinium_carterae.2
MVEFNATDLLLPACPFVLHLYAGPTGEDAFAAAWTQVSSAIPLVEIDIVRGPLHDLLSNTTLAGELRRRAQSGQILAVLGGPNCRTWSRLRFHTPGPPPLRTRDKGTDWDGLPNISMENRIKLQEDNALLQFFLD